MKQIAFTCLLRVNKKQINYPISRNPWEVIFLALVQFFTKCSKWSQFLTPPSPSRNADVIPTWPHRGQTAGSLILFAGAINHLENKLSCSLSKATDLRGKRNGHHKCRRANMISMPSMGIMLRRYFNPGFPLYRGRQKRFGQVA